jgi:hypothetical protein
MKTKLVVLAVVMALCALPFISLADNTYRVVSLYGPVAIISFPANDTVSEGGVTKFQHWVQNTPSRLPLQSSCLVTVRRIDRAK